MRARCEFGPLDQAQVEQVQSIVAQYFEAEE